MDLKFSAITVHFGAVHALAGVDLALAPGEVTVVAGPNGAGKSTLMGVLLGLIRPDGGEVLLNGQPIATPARGTDRRVRERIGYLPEAVAFAPNLSGRQVLRFFAAARGVSRGEVESVLARVGLADAAGRRVHGYSRGMRQRLGLGIAILGSPDLLVLDEPTSGLDQSGLEILWDVLREWREGGRLVLLSTHELALIERRADQLCVMTQGRVCATGTPDALRREIAMPVKVRLDLDGPEHMRALVEALDALAEGPVARSGNHLDVSVLPGQLLAVTRQIPDRGVTRLRVEEPGLDEVYEQIIRRGQCASPVH